MSSKVKRAARLLRAMPMGTLRAVAELHGFDSRRPKRQLIDTLSRARSFDIAFALERRLTLVELRAMCERLGLPAHGSRRELAARALALRDASEAAPRFRSFPAARRFARRLGLRSHAEWRAYVGGKRPELESIPDDIPRVPERHYRDRGWNGWGDFLGTRARSHLQIRFCSFQRARAFARSLGLRSHREWRAWLAGERPELPALPDDIPKAPLHYYRDEWGGWGDFLGTENVYTHWRGFRSYRDARAYARSLGLRSCMEWSALARGRLRGSSRIPRDIPARPHVTYLGKGWTNWGDFLGTGHPPTKGRVWRPFRLARAYVRRLKLRSHTEWCMWRRGDLPDRPPCPIDIPSVPSEIYRDQGWSDWGDFLGTGRTPKPRWGGR